MDEETRSLEIEAQKAAGAAALEAARSVGARAIDRAAENAAKPGRSTSEFWTSVGAMVLGAAAVGLKEVAPLLPAPYSVPALIALGAVTAGAYSLSRGRVKAAALTSAATLPSRASQP